MFVKAAPGLRVPKEGKPRDYITEDVAVDVEASAYYLRRITDGDLIETAEPAAAAKPTKKGAN
jgi:hypothetical protein